MTAEPYPVHWTDQHSAVVVLPEHIDLSNTAEIRSELLSVINRGATALIADMTATISCDHSGADAVARAHQRAVTSGTDLRLAVTSQIVRRVLSIGGIDRLVSVYPSVEAALAARTPAEPGLAPEPGGAVLAGAYASRGGRTVPARPRTVAVAAGQAAPDPGPGTEVALLDRQGVIVSVNDAWQAFAAANQGEPARVGRGVSYLEVCDAAADDPLALEVAAAIRRALVGDLPGPLTVEVPCHSPDTARWFDMLISPRLDDEGRHLGATVTLSLSRSEPLVTLVNDLLVQRLFSAGLSLQTALGMLGDHPAAGEVRDAVSDLDLAIRDFRSFQFDQPAPHARRQ